MSAKPPPAELIALFDSNPGKYKDIPEADGYNATRRLAFRLHQRPQIPNPVAQPDVFEHDPLSAQDLYDALSDAELASIGMEGWKAMRDMITSGDRDGVKRMAYIALQKTWIAQDKYDAIVAYIDSTVPDPDWKATVDGVHDRRATWPEFDEGVRRWYIDEVLGRVVAEEE